MAPADLRDKQVGLFMRDYPYDSVMAARVLGHGLGLAPGKLVDIGVHMVILDTVAYAELCEKFNGGQFPHHRRTGPG
ncbi:hypothetical protein [Streptomyces sp. HF10]|uniref:hypothetical protein n=1 Tax=Streptomyces sp. HF10 TaxID=2692233 RepID=UPI002E2E5029|nr:hypothetical protein [Streptomyces sp. HF10]